MRQGVEIRRLPLRPRTAPTWLGRLYAWLFETRDRQKTIALRHCSPHLLRDIGLTENLRSNHLLREHNFLR
jgi:uncharacterized protein YjiS (DUF1127 family)